VRKTVINQYVYKRSINLRKRLINQPVYESLRTGEAIVAKSEHNEPKNFYKKTTNFTGFVKFVVVQKDYDKLI